MPVSVLLIWQEWWVRRRLAKFGSFASSILPRRLKEIGCDVDIPETGNTLEENALQKAQGIVMSMPIDSVAGI